jgi:hypothetical protein
MVAVEDVVNGQQEAPAAEERVAVVGEVNEIRATRNDG